MASPTPDSIHAVETPSRTRIYALAALAAVAVFGLFRLVGGDAAEPIRGWIGGGDSTVDSGLPAPSNAGERRLVPKRSRPVAGANKPEPARERISSTERPAPGGTPEAPVSRSPGAQPTAPTAGSRPTPAAPASPPAQTDPGLQPPLELPELPAPPEVPPLPPPVALPELPELPALPPPPPPLPDLLVAP